MSHHTLDARNLLCPMPVIKTQNKIKELSVDDTLEVICTDPGTRQDIPAWCRVNGHQIDDIKQDGREITLFITVCSA